MYEQRIQNCINSFDEDVCLIDDGYDLYYFSGLRLSAGVLLLGKTFRGLFVDGRYFTQAQQQDLLDIFPIEALSKQLNSFSSLLFDSAKTPVALFEERKVKNPTLDWQGRPHLTKQMRARKDPKELAKMRESADLTKRALRYAWEGVEDGVTEKAIAWRFESYCREHGADGMAFEPIVAFGENSAYPHHRASEERYQSGQTVLIDVGCVWEGYASDVTRTDAGSSPEMHRIQKVVQEAQWAALQLCRPGVKLKELDCAARHVMRKENLEQFYLHALGHGIGLETHEYPRIRYEGVDAEVTLTAEMVVTIEPGLYIPGLGGIRHEDSIVITPDGIENLYNDLP
jgi:Xaa-Pro aminopeptidase